MAKTKTLDDLFLHGLKDIYYAEKQILKTLPKLAKKAPSEALATAFLTHRDETAGQLERLDKVFELLDRRAQGKTCEGIQGILSEGDETVEEFEDSDVLEGAMIASAQAVEHYEIARYVGLKLWADKLGMAEAVKLLDQNLQEEIRTDKLLTTMAGGRAA
ncbi:MAG: ferritin-like domain-containing protein [Bauldia sp.]